MTPHTLHLPLRPSRRSLFLLGLASLALPAVAAAQPAAAAAPASSRPLPSTPWSQKAMQTRQFPAASIAVVKDGTVVLAKGYGLSDVEKSIKATEQTVYQLASVTKPFTAMAILMLVEDGKLSLDGKITEILPGLPAAWAPVTVRHLLTHTSGIKSYTDVFGEKKVAGQPGLHPRPDPGAGEGRAAAVHAGREVRLLQHRLLPARDDRREGVGQAVRDVPRRRIFKPLGMTSTSLDDYADARPVRARGYSTANGQTTPAEHTHPIAAVRGRRAGLDRRRPGEVGRRARRRASC